MAAGQASLDRRRVRALVRGRVQGVAYRASTAYEAGRLGLAGWVTNQPDGSVLLEAEGPPAAVEALVAWCHHGPSLARVSAVELTDLPAVGEGGPFAIRR